MPEKLTIALARGDGIGPEITDACLHVFERAGVMERVSFREVSMGEAEFEKGNTSGISDEAWKAVEDLGILLKGPMATPTGGGGKSINVTLRKSFGAFANLRHFQTLPGVETVFTKAGVYIDLVIVRENIEDTYGGIEHRLTEDVTQNLRLISAPGCDQVHRFAFESARRMGIGRVHCGHKANIMKITDGLFLSRFHEVGKDYPEIEKDDVIVDALCMNLVMYHGKHDMVVLPNLQGDIVSDLAAGLVGGLGFAPSANIGERIAIFEAVHGTAPDIAGRGIANPTSLLLSGLLMLKHIGLTDTAAAINNALLKALEDGIHTGDVRGHLDPVGTADFAKAIGDRLGQAPTRVAAQTGTGDELEFKPAGPPETNRMMRTITGTDIEHVGCDIYLGSDLLPDELATRLEAMCEGTALKLKLISARGTQVWPTGSRYTECVDHHRCRFERRDQSASIDPLEAADLMRRVAGEFMVVCYIPLKHFDGERGYLLAQGQ